MSQDESTCQSCGMPMAMDEKGGGTETDGALSSLFCSHCYQSGSFTFPDLTVGQMQDRVRGKLVELNLPDHIVGSAIAEIPKLQRWSNP